MDNMDNMGDDFDETLDLLEDLTEDELKDLNETFDPENNLLPIHERVNYECEKAPSRNFNRDQLSQHLKAKPNFGALRPVTHPHSMAEKIKIAESNIGHDYVPFIKPQKDYSNHTLELPQLKSVPRARSPSPLPDLTEEEISCIENATEDELVEVAAQLKMNELVTAEQIESISRGDKPTGTGILRPTLVRTQYPQKSFSIDEDDDEEEYIDVDAMVKAMRSKGEDISIIVCNNQPYMDPEVLEEIAAHLLANKDIRHLSLANCNFTDGVVDSFAEALANNTKLETLNLESNFITPMGIKKILDAIQDSKTLREIRFENQYSKIGPKCEAEMGACIEKNFTLLSFGYSFETRGPRDAMNRHILRNNDILRAARRKGEVCYNLAEQKRIIAKFRPPWVLRRPKTRGPDAFEGRKIVMRGDSKRKKKKGPAMMNEMLAKAAQVSKRWEDKERTGALSSEFQRIEEQSKKKAGDDQKDAGDDKEEKPKEEGTGRRRGRRNREEAIDEGDEDGPAENGDVGRRRGKGIGAVLNSADGLGAMQRRRGRRGGDIEDEDEPKGKKEEEENQDEADGNRGKGRMDAETRKRAMRGGKVIQDEQAPLGAATRRRKKADEDEPEELDFSQFEQKPEEEEEVNDEKESKDSSSRTRIPSGRKIVGQPAAALDTAPLRRRRNKIPADDEEDLDAMLSSVDGGSTQSKEKKREPNGKAIGSQPVNRMETASMKGRRRRRVADDEEGESLDDLLKSVDQKAESKEQNNNDAEVENAESKESDSRRSSVTKLPTGRQVGKQEVAQLSPLSFKNRRRNRVYDDEEEDIDSLLSSVARKSEEEDEEDDVEDEDGSGKMRRRKRLPRGNNVEENEGGLEVAKRKGRSRMMMGSDEEAEEGSMSEEDEEEVAVGELNGKKSTGERRKKRAAIIQGKEGLGVAQRKGRRQQFGDEDDIPGDVTESEESVDENDESADRGREQKGKKEKGARIPKGKQLASQARESLGAVTMKDRRRRVIHDEEEDIDSMLADTVVAKDDSDDKADQNNNETKKDREARIPKGQRITAPPQSGLEAASFKGRRRPRIEDEEEDIDKLLSSAPAIKKEEEKSTKDDSDKAAERRRRRGRGDEEEEEEVANGYQEDIDGRRERRRQRPKDENEEDAEKKREERRRQREATTAQKVSNGPAKEKPAPVEEKKAPEPKKEVPVIKVPERPAVDLTKPMSLRERRRLKEQGLL